MTIPDPKAAALATRKRIVRIAAACGIALALVCQHLPVRYQAACHAVASITQATCGG